MRRQEVQDATGVITHMAPFGTLHIVQTDTPTAKGFNGAAGFAPGCLYQNVTGTVGSVLYVNTGTKTSATWTNVA